MAIQNEILVGRYNRALQKFLGMKGRVPAPQISSEFIAVFPFFFGVENRYLESWQRYGVNFAQTGGAGQFAALQFRNPLTSNTIAVFEKIAAGGLAADSPTLQRATTNVDLPTAVGLTTNRLPDARTQPTPTLIASSSVNATSTGISMVRAFFAANGNVDYILDDDQEIPVSPGDAIQLISNVAAAVLNASFIWRERLLEESERT